MNNGRIIAGTVLIVLGLSALFDINVWHLVWPAIIIFLGTRLLSGPRHGMFTEQQSEEVGNTTVDYSAVFNGMRKKVVSDNFKGGKISAVFGGCEVDLREAKLPKNGIVSLEIAAVFGGVKIIVPETWAVSSSVVGVFGGFTNKAHFPTAKEEQGRLLIKGAAVFGGGEISNQP